VRHVTVPDRAAVRPVLCVLSDLLFRSKIDDVARRLGLSMRVARSTEQMERHLAQSRPSLVLVDLECESLDAGDTIRALKARPDLTGVPVVAFAGHTNVVALRAGRAAGADEVLPRSVFTARLSDLLSDAARSGVSEHAE
jgi:CheY-like chemotaxis protein